MHQMFCRFASLCIILILHDLVAMATYFFWNVHVLYVYFLFTANYRKLFFLECACAVCTFLIYNLTSTKAQWTAIQYSLTFVLVKVKLKKHAKVFFCLMCSIHTNQKKYFYLHF
jgi:hypothetical protein